MSLDGPQASRTFYVAAMPEKSASNPNPVVRTFGFNLKVQNVRILVENI